MLLCTQFNYELLLLFGEIIFHSKWERVAIQLFVVKRECKQQNGEDQSEKNSLPYWTLEGARKFYFFALSSRFTQYPNSPHLVQTHTRIKCEILYLSVVDALQSIKRKLFFQQTVNLHTHKTTLSCSLLLCSLHTQLAIFKPKNCMCCWSFVNIIYFSSRA